MPATLRRLQRTFCPTATICAELFINRKYCGTDIENKLSWPKTFGSETPRRRALGTVILHYATIYFGTTAILLANCKESTGTAIFVAHFRMLMGLGSIHLGAYRKVLVIGLAGVMTSHADLSTWNDRLSEDKTPKIPHWKMFARPTNKCFFPERLVQSLCLLSGFNEHSAGYYSV